jgi:ABC-type cobalamin/Fe3+-siderophores transport system ATPase subunit
VKIIRFEAENVKKLRAVAITPHGNVVQITGANGSGKSSVLDAIFMALAGKSAVPAKPVREGEERATIRLDLGELVVTRKFTSEGATSLTVTTVNGAKFPSPQKMLDELLGSLTFDPLAFTRMEPKAQRTELATLLGIAEQMQQLEQARAGVYASRTDHARELKAVTARRDAIVITTDPLERVDVAAVMAEIATAQDTNQQIERRTLERAAAAKEVQLADDRIAMLEDELAQLREKSARMKAVLKGLKPLAEPVDIAPLRQRVLDAQRINAELDRRAERAALDIEVQGGEAVVVDLSKSLMEYELAKDALIAGAAMPIPGLGFTDDGVMYNGVPFEQASSAEQLRVSVAIAMAANPKLRVLRIKDGSLLDTKSFALLEEMANAQDYQVWIEVVREDSPVGIIMEDGTAREASAALVEAAA